SFFGLVPAALIGVDPDRLLKTVDPIISELIAMPGEVEETAIPLGIALGELALAGIDKATFFLSPALKGFGLWTEQLLAESTGKEGKAVVPVDGEPPASEKHYAQDRFFILIETADEAGGELSRALDGLEKAGHPTARITLRDPLELGGEFLRWEIATAVCGIVLGVNPFDEPNVTESKENTRKVLKNVAETGRLPNRTPNLSDGTIQFFEEGGRNYEGSLEKALWSFLEEAGPPDYVALMAYLDATEEHNRIFQRIRIGIRNARKTATTLGYGPRFLHSTGQLHKGGPATGVFIQITSEEPRELAIPEASYGFGVLKQAQARGDLGSLTGRGLRAVNLHLGQNALEDLKRIADMIDRILV
ncbi:MAG TPA: transaldolase, partial [Nitrospiria bacterium]|nr:transaldolase [Nitrospiria bacterium]